MDDDNWRVQSMKCRLRVYFCHCHVKVYLCELFASGLVMLYVQLVCCLLALTSFSRTSQHEGRLRQEQ